MSRKEFLTKWASRIDADSPSASFDPEKLKSILQVRDGFNAAGKDAVKGAVDNIKSSLDSVADEGTVEEKTKKVIDALNNGDLRLAKTDLSTLAAAGLIGGGLTGLAAGDPGSKFTMAVRGAGAGAGGMAGAKIGEGLGKQYLKDKKHGDLIGMALGGTVGALGGSSVARALWG